MKLIAKKIEHLETKTGTRVTFDCDSYPYNQLVSKLQNDKYYSIEVKEIKSKRSLAQNRYMWALIKDIAEYVGIADEMDLYCQFLEISNVKFDYVAIMPEVANKIRGQFRGMLATGRSLENEDGETLNEYKVFIGSSKFTTEEMNRLIDSILNYAAEIGIPSLDYYNDVLRG